LDLIIEVVDLNNPKYEQLLQIRKDVFVKEQKVPEELEIDKEHESVFYLASLDNVAMATGRYRKKADKYFKIERVATLPKYRGKGLGKKLMLQMLEDIFKNNKHAIPFLYSQDSAVDFYKKLGFYTIGDEFYEAGIKHFKMLYLEHFLDELKSL
jgi:predicted GNAT family N-acyltransferase